MIRAWGAVATNAQLANAQQEIIEAVFDDSLATRFSSVKNALGLPLASFRNRLMQLGNHHAIAGINFQEPQGNAAFVCFLRSTMPLGSVSDWSSFAPVITASFDDFQPRLMQFFHPGHLPLTAPTIGIDDYLLAGKASKMAQKPKTDNADRVVLRRSTSLEFYPRYQAMYEAIYGERPQLRGEVRTEPQDNLAICLNEGFLFEIVVDGRWAGIVAAKWRTLVAIHGVFMVEIVLSPEARGQNLAPTVHRLFAAKIVEMFPAAVITGTISSKNQWSLKAALRAGRVEVGAWHWVAL